MTALALPVRRAIADVTVGRGALAFWLCVPIVVGALLLVRNSSMVAVESVKIVGLDGYYEKHARRSLEAEALTMSTLNVDEGRLRDSLSEFIDVAGIRTATDFPHGLTVYVSVRRPVASARVGSRVAGVTASGLVLGSARNLSLLPRIDLQGPVKDNHVRGAESRQLLTVLGAAPDVLLRRVKSVRYGARGVVVTLKKGTQLIFGSPAQAGVKWRSAAAVLADPAAKGARYVDLRVADRPAIGGLGAAPVAPKPLDEMTTPQTPSQVQSQPGSGAGPSGAVSPPAATVPQAAPAPVAGTPAPQPPSGTQQGGTVTP